MSRRGRNKSKFSLFAFQDIITSVTGIMVLVTLMLALELIQRKESSSQAQSKQIIEQATEVTGDIDEIRNNITQTENEINRVRQILAQKKEDAVDLATHDVEKVRERVGDLRRIQTELVRELEDLARQLAKVRASNNEAKDKDSQLDPKEVDKLRERLAEAAKQLKELQNSKARIYTPNPGESRSLWLIELSDRKILVAQAGKAGVSEFSSMAAFDGWLDNRKSSADYFMLLVKPDGVSLFAQVQQLLRQENFGTGYDLLAKDEVAIDPKRGADF